MEKQIEFLYEKDDNYFDAYVTGMYGGTTPMDTIKIYLFEEAFNYPKSEIQYIINNTLDRSEITIDKNIRRIVKGSLVIPLSELPGIIRWLNEKLEAHRDKGRTVNKNE